MKSPAGLSNQEAGGSVRRWFFALLITSYSLLAGAAHAVGPASGASGGGNAAAVPLYRIAGPTAGQSLDLSQTPGAAASGGSAHGRVTPLEHSSFSAASAVAQGDRVLLPLADNEAVEATISFVRQEQGHTRVAGAVGDGDGSFFLSTNGKDVSGLIQFPSKGTAFRIEQAENGVTTLHELARGEVICVALPREDDGSGDTLDSNHITVPVLNSRPAAVAQLYLDFDGETVSDPAWDGGNTIVAPPQNLTPTQITEIFERVKEDWWPFNINITTSVDKYNAAPVGSRMRVIITTNNQAAPGAGGVAYIDSFSKAGRAFTTNVPSWVFNTGVIAVSETISHELGHTVGLLHDGRLVPGQPPETYFKGHGAGATSWGPIMGGTFRQNVGQWSKGEYQFADRFEDDLAIISKTANGFGYVPDDVSNSTANATGLPVAADNNFRVDGVISSATDSDFFSFSTTGGRVTINASGARPSQNLDIALDIRNSAGAVVASANPPGELNATAAVDLVAGSYFISVAGSGAGNPLTDGYSNYASIGAYQLSGVVPGGAGGGGGGTGNRANLTGFKPNDWADKIVVSKVTGTTTDDTPLLASDSLFIDFALLNNGTAEAAAGYRIELYVDDVLRSAYTGTVLAPNFFSAVRDFAAGTLAAGTHTIRVKLDTNNALNESNEADNEFTKTILVSGGTSSNNSFASPAVLSGTSGQRTDSNTAATAEPGEPVHAGVEGGKSVWYQWTAPSSSPVTFDTLGSDFDTLLAVYTGNSVSGLTAVASNDDVAGGIRASSVSFRPTAGAVYRIAVDGFRGAAGNIVLNFYSAGPGVTSFTPGNGSAGTIVTITGTRFAGATVVQFNTAEANFEIISETQIRAVVPPGATTGPVRVSNLSGTGSSAANFVIGSTRPQNDAFANRIPINGREAAVTGTNIGASKEPGEPAHAGDPGGVSVWWTWTAPETGSYVLSTRTSDFDTLLAVYSGTAVGQLTLVAENDDDLGTTSRLLFNATAGTAYHFAVDGYSGVAGTVNLALRPNTSERPQLANISTRLNVGQGENVLIGGFIITGAEPKNVIIRAIGPSLPIRDALADPTLELYDSAGRRVYANDDWKESQALEVAATGIPPRDDLESAMVLSLAPGPYTGVLSGFNDTTGVGLIEIYDLDPTAQSAVANISTRGVVERGDSVMIGGLIVVGKNEKRVIVRALGPSLQAAGVSSAISDTTLTLHDSNGAIVAFNDDWRDTQESTIVGTTIPPSDNLESAVVANLPPGFYTAVVRGFEGATGVGLVEVYDLD